MYQMYRNLKINIYKGGLQKFGKFEMEIEMG